MAVLNIHLFLLLLLSLTWLSLCHENIQKISWIQDHSPPVTLEALLSSSTDFFHARVSRLRRVGPGVNQYQAQVQPTMNFLSPPVQYSKFELTYVADNKTHVNDGLFHFPFEDGEDYLIFLNKTQTAGEWKLVGVRLTQVAEVYRLYPQYCRYFRGLWQTQLSLNSTEVWYQKGPEKQQGNQEKMTPEPEKVGGGRRVVQYEVAAGAPLTLACTTPRLDLNYYPGQDFLGYNLTLVLPSGHRISHGPSIDLKVAVPDWDAGLEGSSVAPLTTSPKGHEPGGCVQPSVVSTVVQVDGSAGAEDKAKKEREYRCEVSWPRGKVLHHASIVVASIDPQRPPSLAVERPLPPRTCRQNYTTPPTATFRFWSYPEANFTWNHPDGRVLASGSCGQVSVRDECGRGRLSLQLSTTSVRDVGNYSLTLSTHGRFVNLHVNTFFNLSCDANNTSLTMTGGVRGYVHLGSNITVSCTTWGFPPPALTLSVCTRVACTNRSQEEGWAAQSKNQKGAAALVQWKWRVAVGAAPALGLACHAQDSASPTTTLLVSDAPTLKDHELQATQTVLEGSNVILTCRVSLLTSPPTALSWVREGEDQGEDRRREEVNGGEQNAGSLLAYNTTYSAVLELHLRPVQLTDAGSYSCSRTSAVARREVVRVVDLVVTAAEPPTWVSNSTANTTYQLHPHETLTLACAALGIPSPAYTWIKDGRELVSEEEGGEEEASARVFSADGASLTLLKGRQQDAGRYQCRATNRLGALSVWFLVSFVAPEVPPLHTVVAVVVPALTLLLAGLVFVVLRKRWWRWRVTKEQRKAWALGNVAALNPTLPLHHQADLLPFVPDFEFSRNNITFDKLLGCGAFGRVYRAVAAGLAPGQGPTTVAVKMVKSRSDKAQLLALQSELKILIHVGRHTNIVNLLAACTKNLHKRGELLILVEYCKFGNILDFMRKNQRNFFNQLDDSRRDFLTNDLINQCGRTGSSEQGYVRPHQFLFGCGETIHSPALTTPDLIAAPHGHTAEAAWEGGMTQPSETNTDLMSHMTCNTQISDTHNLDAPELSHDPEDRSRPLCSRDLLSWAFQIARGMEYLAFRKVLHGDLAARNVLLCDGNVVKISDFGLARDIYKYSNYKKNKNLPLPVKWMSVEALRDGIFSTQSDVWAFGVVMWEIFSLGRRPYPGVVVDDKFITSLQNGYRMEQPTFASTDLYQMILHCWALQPVQRPSFTSLERRLSGMLRKLDFQYFDELQERFEQETASVNETGVNKAAEGYLNMISNPDYASMTLSSLSCETASNKQTTGEEQTKETSVLCGKEVEGEDTKPKTQDETNEENLPMLPQPNPSTTPQYLPMNNNYSGCISEVIYTASSPVPFVTSPFVQVPHLIVHHNPQDKSTRSVPCKDPHLIVSTLTSGSPPLPKYRRHEGYMSLAAVHEVLEMD